MRALLQPRRPAPRYVGLEVVNLRSMCIVCGTEFSRLVPCLWGTCVARPAWCVLQDKRRAPGVSLASVRHLSAALRGSGSGSGSQFGLTASAGPFHGLLGEEVRGLSLAHVPVITAAASLLPLESAAPGERLPVHLVKFHATFTVTATGLSMPKVRGCAWLKCDPWMPTLPPSPCSPSTAVIMLTQSESLSDNLFLDLAACIIRAVAVDGP